MAVGPNPTFNEELILEWAAPKADVGADSLRTCTDVLQLGLFDQRQVRETSIPPSPLVLLRFPYAHIHALAHVFIQHPRKHVRAIALLGGCWFPLDRRLCPVPTRVKPLPDPSPAKPKFTPALRAIS